MLLRFALRTRSETGQAGAKMVIFEHRRGAYIKYVSIDAQKSAICRPAWRVSNRMLSDFPYELQIMMIRV